MKYKRVQLPPRDLRLPGSVNVRQRFSDQPNVGKCAIRALPRFGKTFVQVTRKLSKTSAQVRRRFNKGSARFGGRRQKFSGIQRRFCEIQRRFGEGQAKVRRRSGEGSAKLWQNSKDGLQTFSKVPPEFGEDSVKVQQKLNFYSN